MEKILILLILELNLKKVKMQNSQLMPMQTELTTLL